MSERARLVVPIAVGVTLVVGLVLVAGVGPVAAHETKTVEGYELTFGGAEEPVVTDERAWLQVEVSDADSGEPVEGQADSLELAVQRPFGDDTFALEVGGVHGQPGLYEGAVVFTEPGTYTIHVSGTIEGTAIDVEFSKQVHDAGDLEYPESGDSGLAGLALDGPIGFGLGAVTAAVGMVAAFLVGRRR